ncbi:MAG TPA: aryl-sulfate sulfotransferase, partial [Gemmataceae bacterium]|nr:aryl-sulfate sulfotransferase [Gemmataceae bacterium]
MKRLLGLLALAVALYGASLVAAQDSGGKDGQPPKDKAKAALTINDPQAFQGYTLISPMMSTKSYLIDIQGRIVRTWEGAAAPELCAYLLPNGNLLRPCAKDKGGMVGVGGRIQEFTFDGELVWDYKFPTEKYLPHHDITKLPNGNILAIVYEKKTAQEATAAGRKGNAVLEVDNILEIQPKGKDGGDIVWQWSAWD